MKRVIIGLMVLSLLFISGISSCSNDDQTCYNDDEYCCPAGSSVGCWIPGHLFVQFNESVSGEAAFNFVHSLGLKTLYLTPGGEYRNAALIIIDLPKGKELSYLSTLNKTGLVKSVSLSEIYPSTTLPPVPSIPWA